LLVVGFPRLGWLEVFGRLDGRRGLRRPAPGGRFRGAWSGLLLVGRRRLLFLGRIILPTDLFFGRGSCCLLASAGDVVHWSCPFQRTLEQIPPPRLGSLNAVPHKVIPPPKV